MNTGWRDSPPSGETPRWRCAYRGYGVVRSCSPDKALAPLSGKLPGGAALTGATGLCGRVARIRRWRRYPGNSPGGAALTGATGSCGRVARIRRIAPLSGNKVGLFRQRSEAGEYAVKNRQPFRNLLGADGTGRHHVNAVFHHKGQQTGFG